MIKRRDVQERRCPRDEMSKRQDVRKARRPNLYKERLLRGKKSKR